MRDTWYGDQRDLVKWGTLAYLAKSQSLSLIVQVPYLRPGKRPCLRSLDGEVEVSPEVWAFFRDVKGVESLGDRIGRRIWVIDEQFARSQRDTYRQNVVAKLESLRESKVVLLDPDTGIEPSKATPEHATISDVRAILQVLRPGDWLVLYQHAQRRATWREDACSKFGAACDGSDVKVYCGPEIAPDVAFLAARK